MKQENRKRIGIAGTLLAAAIAFAPGVALAAKAAAVDRAEARITEMHAKLKITAAQEDQWGKVADVMRANGKQMDTLAQARFANAKSMTAVDDLKSYAEIADAHADGMKKFTPVFTTLYAGMSDAQKKEADTLFRQGSHKMSKSR
jgi:periplasmic protein CpxP/Spy